MTMTLKRNTAPWVSAALLACACSAGAAGEPPMSKDAFHAAMQKIELQGKSERKACDTQRGRAAELCTKEAKAREKIARAELEAQYEPTPENWQEARNVKADAEYAVAREKCGDLKGAAKDRCVTAAKSAREAAIRLAKVEKVDSMRAAEREAAAERKAAIAKARP
jgi:hypothetical protein